MTQMQTNARTCSSVAEATVTTLKARSAASVQRDSRCLRPENNVKVRCVSVSYFNTATFDSVSAPDWATVSVSLCVAVRLIF